MPGTRDVAFVRSPVAHARLRGVTVPDQFKDAVITAKDLPGLKPISSNPPLRGFKFSTEPVLASDKLRFVGEIVAMCVARTRAEAEDIASLVSVEYRRAPGGDRHDRRPGARLAARARKLEGQRFHRVRRNRRRDGEMAAKGGHHGHARDPHRPPLHAADGRARRPRLSRSALASAHRRHFLAIPPFGADGPVRVPWPQGRRCSRHLTRRRRRLRLQGRAEPRRGRARAAGDAARSSRALDRGLPRAPDRQRQLPGASLPHHRLRLARGKAAGRSIAWARSTPAPIPPTRSRRHWRRRRSRTCCRAPMCCPAIAAARRGRHQQMPHPAVPRRCPHRHLPRDRSR